MLSHQMIHKKYTKYLDKYTSDVYNYSRKEDSI